MKRNKYNPIDDLILAYNLLIEIMENPRRKGYEKLIKKIKYGSKPPLNIYLFDFKQDIDIDIRDITNKILKRIEMDNMPGGIKD